MNIDLKVKHNFLFQKHECYIVASSMNFICKIFKLKLDIRDKTNWLKFKYSCSSETSTQSILIINGQ